MTLDIITNDLLDGTTHGFFGRQGGVSSGVFWGLNCGLGSSDQHDTVAINRSLAAKAMGGTADDMVGVHQIHSADVIEITAATSDTPKADAMVTAAEGIILSVLSADCQPVLFADKVAGVIGAAHAGWKGVLHGILDNTIDEMVALGALRKNIVAVIGPSISQKVYEVGPEFAEKFLKEDSFSSRYFTQGFGDRLHFNLPAFGLDRLWASGIKDAVWTQHCTYGDPARFFSYRRSVHEKQDDYGRLIAAIRL